MTPARPLQLALLVSLLSSCSDGKGGGADDGDGGAAFGEGGADGAGRDGSATGEGSEGGEGGEDGEGGEGGSQGGTSCVCDDLYPVCVEDTGECVECSDEVRGACRGATPLCADHRCVACLADSDCVEPRAPVCDDGACVACTDDAQCGDGRVCDTATGACGECTAEKRDACESGGAATVCDVLSRVCTTFAPGSAGACAGCVSDDHCAPGHACVEQTFGDRVVGTFCLPVEVSGCARPYIASLSDMLTVEGRSVSVCGPAQTTCPALTGSTGYGAGCGVDARGEPVATGAVRGDDALCGMKGLDDAVCIDGNSQGEFRCTLSCEFDGQAEVSVCPARRRDDPESVPNCRPTPHYAGAGDPALGYVCGI